MIPFTLSDIETWLFKYGLDFSSYTDFEKGITLICLGILSWFICYFIINVIYKIICRFQNR